MDPVTISAAATAVLALVDWKKVFQGLATDTASKTSKGLLARLKPDDREKAARRALAIFAEEFLAELEDKTPLTSALPGYRDQLKRLMEHAAPDITSWFRPETKEVDLSPVQRTWTGLGLDPLPEDFDWTLLAKSYARDIRKHVKTDPALRSMLDTALLEEQTELQRKSEESLARLAGPDPGFDLTGYREYLRKKCSLLQLSAMHTSAYDRRVSLWSVFVSQSAREYAPVRDLPRELLRRLREEGHVTSEYNDAEIARLREGYLSSPVSPVLDILKRDRLLVVLGDPGSGKTSLLKFLVMSWSEHDLGRLPVWVDLKEYAQERDGLLKYCESGCATYGLDAREVEKRLKAGEAALYLDGLDEIFDGPTRGSVIEEIAACAQRYSQAPVVVTSRSVGYEAERFGNVGFTHATLEDFDDKRVSEFLAKWHDTAEEDPKERARLQNQLDRALRESRAVRDLAGNPLLLTMMAILNRNQELPRDRVELYAQASRVLLHDWDARRALQVDKFERQDKEELLRELAGVMQQREGGLAGNLIDRTALVGLFRQFLNNLGVPDPYGSANSLVKQLEERNFILCFAGADHFSFVHRTFLEYFCASWFVDKFQKKQTLTMEELKNDVFSLHWKEETWHEVLRLIAGMVGEKQAEELILSLMKQDGRSDKLTNLMLAAGCLSEVRNRRAIQTTDESLRRRFTEEVIRFKPSYYYEPQKEISEAGPTREKAVGLIAFVWRSETTRDWLRSAADGDHDWIVRRAAIRELARGWKDDLETLSVLKERARTDADSNVRTAAVQEVARGWKDDPETLHWLKKCCSDEDIAVRIAAVPELARGLKDAPEIVAILRELASSGADLVVRILAVGELARGWKDDPETLPWLKERARADAHDDVRSAAVQEVARGWKDDPETLPWLKERARSDAHNDVRNAAVMALAGGWKDDPETLPWLKELARSDADDNARMAAVQELARGWKDDPENSLLLKELARSDADAVRWVAVLELARGWKDDPETLSILKERARSDTANYVRTTALRELRGWKDDPEVIAMLHATAVKRGTES